MEKIIKEVGSRYRDGDIKITWEVNDNGGTVMEGDKDGSYFVVSWGEAPSCQNTGKGDILFFYNTHSEREIIEKTLGATFLVFHTEVKITNLCFIYQSYIISLIKKIFHLRKLF